MKAIKNTSKKGGYSIIIALFIVGFLLIVSTGVFRLVLSELQDNRGRAGYMKAFYGAESGIELALLEIKDFGYGVQDRIDLSPNNKSIMLANNPKDISKYIPKRDTLISFDINSKIQVYSGSLVSGEHVIIPLFYIDPIGNGVQHDSKNISVSVGVNASSIIWNIVGLRSGISGEGSFTKDTIGANKTSNDSGKINDDGKKIVDFGYEQKSVESFLQHSNNNYLILFNSHPTDVILYSVSSSGGYYFSRPVGEILASGKVDTYKQNIKTTLDNTAYLNILKYSIFSN